MADGGFYNNGSGSDASDGGESDRRASSENVSSGDVPGRSGSYRIDLKNQGFGAKNSLRAAENKAIGGSGEQGGEEGQSNIDDVRKREEGVEGAGKERAGGFYSGNGGLKAAQAGNAQGKAGFGGRLLDTLKTLGDLSNKPSKAKLKKLGPIGGIIGVIVVIGGIFSGAQSLMPIAIQEMIIEKFNSIGISSTMTSDHMLDTQLNYGIRLTRTTTVDEISGGDVTIIGDSISVDSAHLGLFDQMIPGAFYGTQTPGEANHNSFSKSYGGKNYTILDYGKSFKTSKSYAKESERVNNQSGLEVVRTLAQNGELRKYVLFLLGTNDCPSSVDGESCSDNLGWLKKENIDELMSIVGTERKVVLMTNYVHTGRGWNFDQNNTLIRNAALEYEGRIAIADWANTARDDFIRQNDYDGNYDFHFTNEGGRVFVQTVKDALNSFRTYKTTSQSVGVTDANLFAFSKYQVEQFRNQGIIVFGVDSDTVTQFTAMLFRKDDTYIPVVGSQILNNPAYSVGDLANAIRYVNERDGMGLKNIGTPISVKEAFNESAFKIPYTTASRSWRGGSSGWFDEMMSNITEAKLSINRNRWARYAAKGVSSITEAFREAASSSIKKSRTTTDSDLGIDDLNEDSDPSQYHDVEYDSSGKPTKGYSNYDPGDSFDVIDESGQSTDHITTSDDELTGSSTLSEINTVLNSKAIKVASAAADGTCAILEGVMTIYTIASAYQNLQFLNLISGYLEAIDKVKAGDGANSPVHEYGINMTTKADTVSSRNDTVVSKDKTAMDSAGIKWLFAKNHSINADDPSVQNVNFESIMDDMSIFSKDIKNTAKLFEKCGYAKVATASIDAITTILSFIPIAGQGIKAVQLTAKGIRKGVIKAVAVAAFYLLIPIAARQIAKMLIKDAATEWFGEDLGNAVISGANKYLGGNGTSGGQSIADKEHLLAYLGARDDVIADEAEYQRAIRSPFDVSSQYTFLGSLAYAMIPMAYSGGGIMSTVNNLSSAVSSSIVATLPTASAIDKQSLLTSNGTCNLLSTIDAEGDAFCNAYVITDVSTMNMAIEDVYKTVATIGWGDNEIASLNDTVSHLDSDNFSVVDGKTRINPRSELGYYASFCGQRVSPYGIKDMSIIDRITRRGETASKIIDFIPFLNDVKDIYEGLTEQANLDWANGHACVASDGNERWDHNQYYQRYAETERWLESTEPGYVSTVTDLAMEYYKENPIDDSFEGTLARFSGLPKETVEDGIALFNYYLFIDEYDVESRYAFNLDNNDMRPLRFDNDNKLADNIYMILLNAISFADVRNRNFVV